MKIVFSHMLMLLVFIDICHVCTGVCHNHLPKHLNPSDKSNWKLCVRRNHTNIIQLKIYRFFKSSPTAWLGIGFPEAGGKISDLILVTKKTNESKSVKVQQLSTQYMSCHTGKSPKVFNNAVIVNCEILNHTIKQLYSNMVSIFYLTGKTGLKNLDKTVNKNMISNGTKLSFNLYIYENTIEQDAGSTAMKLLRNYGKSMAAIIGIAFVLTTFITATICCCCKKDKAMGTLKEKDVSVSFYRDNGEVASESDSDNQDEKVAFIRNNNGRNSNV